MTTRTQIGNVCTESDGNELTVYVENYGTEEPNCVILHGKACMIVFDPGTMEGRGQLRTVAARLHEALAHHSARVEEIYGALKPGDYCNEIRVPYGDERNCPHTIPTDGHTWQCSRVHHEDFHHVAVDDTYRVIAVRHATDHILRGA